MKVNLESGGDDVRIEIIPLIDVIFCILTFFILAALQLTRQQGIRVDLPRAGTGTPQIREMLIVSTDVLGQIYIDQQPVTEEELKQRLLGFKQQNPDGLMVLYAPRNAIYEDVVELLDLLRSIGGESVALATLPSTSQQQRPAFNDPNLNLPGGSPYGNPLSPQLGAPLSPLPGQFPDSTLPGQSGGVPRQIPEQLPGQTVPLPGVSPTPVVPIAPQPESLPSEPNR